MITEKKCSLLHLNANISPRWLNNHLYGLLCLSNKLKAKLRLGHAQPVRNHILYIHPPCADKLYCQGKIRRSRSVGCYNLYLVSPEIIDWHRDINSRLGNCKKKESCLLYQQTEEPAQWQALRLCTQSHNQPVFRHSVYEHFQAHSP